MIEIEKTYLAKYIPKELPSCARVEILDHYFPITSAHPKLRIRKKTNSIVMTKKTTIADNASKQIEQNINLSNEEYKTLANIPNKKIHKTRYNYPLNGLIAEFDIFLDDLFGLVLIDIEFPEEQYLKDFKQPDFCLTDVSQEEFVAGGKLAGKSFAQIKKKLGNFGYSPIYMDLIKN
jgi:CYTH domain-containing protein